MQQATCTRQRLPRSRCYLQEEERLVREVMRYMIFRCARLLSCKPTTLRRVNDGCPASCPSLVSLNGAQCWLAVAMQTQSCASARAWASLARRQGEKPDVPVPRGDLPVAGHRRAPSAGAVVAKRCMSVTGKVLPQNCGLLQSLCRPDSRVSLAFRLQRFVPHLLPSQHACHRCT